MAVVTIHSDFGAQEIKSVTVSIVSQLFAMEWWDRFAIILVFWMFSFKPAFHSPLSPSSIGSLDPLHFLPLEWYHLHIWGCVIIYTHCFFQRMILATLTTGWHEFMSLVKVCVCCVSHSVMSSSPGSSVHGILQARILEWVVQTKVQHVREGLPVKSLLETETHAL